MKQHDITKLCADSLRSFLNDEHNIKLGASHAHELVAAFFGYSSRAAMLADARCPVHNLEKAEFILFNPPMLLVDQRLKELKDIPHNLPASTVLVEGVYAPLIAEKKFLEKIWPTSLNDLAVFLAEERVRQHTKHWRMSLAPQWVTDVEIKILETEVIMIVTFYSSINIEKRSRHAKVGIKLTRLAANAGYGNPEIVPTFYSGQMCQPI